MTAAARSDYESGTAHLSRFRQDASERWSVTAEVMAQALGGRRAGSAWMARYPAHDDRVPSLAIDERSDGTVLVCCHAGCSQHAVINALTARGLWPGVSGRSLAQVPVPPRQRTDRGAAAELDARRRRDVDLASERARRRHPRRDLSSDPWNHAAAPEGAESSCQRRRQEREDLAVHPTNAIQPPAACRDVPANGGDPHRLRPEGGVAPQGSWTVV